MGPDLSGQIVNGSIRVLCCVSRSAELALYKAEFLRNERPMLLKVAAPELRYLVIGEARHLSTISHPNVALVRDFGTLEDDSPYLVLEALDGITLRDHLRHGEPFTMRQAVGLAVQLCSAIQAFHDARVVLRQLCPEHIILLGARDTLKVWSCLHAGTLPDPADPPRLIRGPRIEDLHAPAYVSPELALLESKVDGRSDLYSAGIILFELLAGCPPFAGATTMGLLAHQIHTPPPPLPNLPDPLARLVHRAMAKAPEDRFGSAQEMQRELEAILSSSV